MPPAGHRFYQQPGSSSLLFVIVPLAHEVFDSPLATFRSLYQTSLDTWTVLVWKVSFSASPTSFARFPAQSLPVPIQYFSGLVSSFVSDGVISRVVPRKKVLNSSYAHL